VRNGITAKRGVRVRGSRAAAGWPVRAAQPLRPSPSPRHHEASVRAAGLAMAAVWPNNIRRIAMETYRCERARGQGISLIW
jgi:hypothetical protein